MSKSSIPKSNIIYAIEHAIGFKKHVKMLLQRNNMDFEVFEKYFQLLNENHNGVQWLKEVTRIAHFIDICDGDDAFSTGIFKANIYHLKKLVNFSEELREVYNTVVIDDLYLMDHAMYTFYRNDLYVFPCGKIREDHINFDNDFIFWDTDDLIDNIHAYLTKDSMYYKRYSDKKFNWFFGSVIPEINDDIKQLILNAINKYYLNRTRERTKIYKTELMDIALTPERVFDWCLDEDSKKRFKK